jgi:hypothetical protein
MNIPFENQATTAPTPTLRFEPAKLGAIKAYQLHHARAWMSVLPATPDILCLTAAGLLSISIRFSMDGIDQNSYLRFLCLPALFVVVFILRQLYPTIGPGAVEEFRRLTINISFVLVRTIWVVIRRDGAA